MTRYNSIRVLLSILLITAVYGQKDQMKVDSKIVQKTDLNYLLFLPESYNNDQETKWPLILFLHGIGERGNDLKLLKIHGIPKIVEKEKKFP